MRRLLQFFLLLILLGLAALLGYAYLGDLSPQRAESRVGVSLPGIGAPAAPAPEAAGEAAPEAAPAPEAPSGN